MALTLQQILAERNPAYEQERALIAQQQAALAPQEQADLAGLDTAKTTAFGDITNQANARGIVYSGAPIAEQQRYVGERFLPAVAQAKATYANKRTSLEAALLDVGRRQTTEATQELQRQQEADAQASYRAEQLQIERQKVAQAAAQKASTAAAKKAPNPATGYSLKKDPGGGFQFSGPNNRPVTAAQYAAVTGTSVAQILASSGNKKDQQILALLNNPNITDEELIRRYPEVFGGV